MYDWVDKFHMLHLGDYADFSCAYFNGDFSKTLEQAQRDKHELIFSGIKFKSGQHILDIGSGWGPILKAVKDKGGTAVGLTLSRAQTHYCKKKGLDGRLQDWKTANSSELGYFDGITSVGAFEHFCSVKEMQNGRQEDIYRQFFKFCCDLLPPRGNLFLQTMTWGRKVPDYDKVSFGAPEGTKERILARMEKFYPGSWLPNSLFQIVETAKPYFRLVTSINGGLDYIETLHRWEQSYKNLFTPKNFLYTFARAISLIPRYFSDPDFRIQIESVRRGDQMKCFEDKIMNHERMFFEKIR